MFDRIERLLDWLQFFHIQDKSALKPQGRQGRTNKRTSKTRGLFHRQDGVSVLLITFFPVTKQGLQDTRLAVIIQQQFAVFPSRDQRPCFKTDVAADTAIVSQPGLVAKPSRQDSRVRSSCVNRTVSLHRKIIFRISDFSLKSVQRNHSIKKSMDFQQEHETIKRTGVNKTQHK